MGIKNKIYPGYLYFQTITVIDWVDLFTRPHYKHLLLDSLKYCQQQKGLGLYAWCLLTNHRHLIASAREGTLLSDILRDFKKYTSKTLLKAIQQEHESRRDWLLNRFAYAGANDSKITAADLLLTCY